MDSTAEPTVILKSLKDFNKFLSEGQSSRDSIGGENIRLFHDGMKSPRLKLDFSDSFSNATVNDTINDSDSYLQRHRDRIVRFDITRKIREKDCEINETRAKVSMLESQIQTQKTNYKKRKLDLESEVDTYRRKALRDQELLDDLQHKVKELQMKAQESREELLRIQKATNTKCSQMEKKMLQMQIDHAERSKKNHEEFSHLREHAEKLEKDMLEKESLLSTLEANNKELEEWCNSLQKKLATSERAQLAMDSMKLKLSQTEMANKELQMRLGNVKHQETQYELFERLLKQRPVLEKEMFRLKEEINMLKLTGVNVCLVEEKLAAAESQIHRLETRCSELTAENGTLSTLHETSEQYETALMKELSLEYVPPVSELIDHIQSLKNRDTEASNSLTDLRVRENLLKAVNLHSQALFDRLQQENEDLKKEVKLLEEGGETLTLTEKDVVTVDTDPCASKQLGDLERKVVYLKIKRFLEAAKKRWSEMREVVWLLLGYRVDLGRDNDEIKLFHVYGESQDDYLLFKRDEDGTIELLENEFSLSLERIKVDYLHPSGSYPAFLAAATLELYNNNAAVLSPDSSDAEDEQEDFGIAEE